MFAWIPDALGTIMTVVGLGALIFFHELGHFIACLLTGTRVEAFSVGFGKEIFGWTRGPTRYRIGIVPLGGYVKMAAENPGDHGTGAPDEFPNKSFSQRLFIMSNGVIFNILLAFIFFVIAFGYGTVFSEPAVGATVHGGPAWKAGLRSGDVVKSIDGSPVLTFTDLRTEIAFASEGPLAFVVRRGEKDVELEVTPVYSEEQGMLMIGVAPRMAPEALAVEPGSAIEEAGGREKDVVIALNGQPVRDVNDAEFACNRLAGMAPADAATLPVTMRVRRADGTEEDLDVALRLTARPQIGIVPFEAPRIVAVAPGYPLSDLVRVDDELGSINGRPAANLWSGRQSGGDEPLTALTVKRGATEVAIDVPAGATVGDLFSSMSGHFSLEAPYVAPRKGMAAERAGVLAGDKVLRAAGREIKSFRDLQAAIIANGSQPLDLVVERGEKQLTLEIVPGRFADPLGYRYGPKQATFQETSIISAVGMGVRRTIVSIKTVALAIRGLVTRRVSHKHIGGPIALAQATYTMWDQGLGRYLYILALLSVNLAILNILPIPILDGGQIVLLCAEKLRGKPLPDRLVGYYQLVGLALILGLMFLAFKNDITGLLQ